MPIIGNSPNKTYTRSDGVRTGSAICQQERSGGLNNTAELADARENDLATAINAMLMKDGGNRPTANIDFNGFRIVNAGSAAGPNDYMRKGDADSAYQPKNATLTSLSALGTVADKYAYTTGENTWAQGSITSSARTLLASPTAAFNCLGIAITNNGNVLNPGVIGDLTVPYNCQIQNVRVLCDQTGSCVVDIWRTGFTGYPPNSGNSICSSSKPTISGNIKMEDLTLSGWTISLSFGDTLRFYLESVSNFTRLAIFLTVSKL